jgi:hypothetical protein
MDSFSRASRTEGDGITISSVLYGVFVARVVGGNLAKCPFPGHPSGCISKNRSSDYGIEYWLVSKTFFTKT